MGTSFDEYRSSYGDVVEQSISFSSLKHDFFLVAKADYLQRVITERGLRQGGRGISALDVGCGIGSLHRHLDGVVDTLAGCDISAESIARAEQDFPGNAYRSYEPTRLPYDDGVFDLAFASCVLHHVPPASWADFMAEMRRVLRPGGIACVIEHNPLNPLTRLAVFRCPFDEDAVLLRSGRTASLFRAAGFSDIRTEHILLMPSDRPMARRVERAFAALPFGAQYGCSARV